MGNTPRPPSSQTASSQPFKPRCLLGLTFQDFDLLALKRNEKSIAYLIWYSAGE